MAYPDDYIKIDIKNPKRFGDVSLLIDRPDFIVELWDLRKKWNIDSKGIKKDNNKSWYAFPWLDEPKKLSKKQEQDALYLFNSLVYVEVGLNPIEEDKRLEKALKYCSEKIPQYASQFQFRFDVIQLRKRYKRYPNFDSIIAHALLYKNVTDSEYVTCELKLQYAGFDQSKPFKEPYPAIVFYPRATVEDITKIFREESEKILHEYETKYLNGKIFSPDTVSNIERDREWYWLHQLKLSYAQISELQTKQNGIASRDMVIKAIKRYEKLLAVNI